MAWIYGPVRGKEDISRINCIIRDEMLIVETPEQLTELKKRSDYLCTLTYSPFWKKKFGDEIEEIRQVALEENRATTILANYVAKFKGWDKEYSPWGKDKYGDFDNHLRTVEDEVLSELERATLDFRPEIEVDLRRVFCRIRFLMLFVKKPEELFALKKRAEAWVWTVFGRLFAIYLEPDVLSKLKVLAEEEFERTIKLANIIASVKGWDIEFEGMSQEYMEQEEMDIEEMIETLMEEAEKASEYIPTEAKYKAGAKVLWIVYKSRSGRTRAKRVYIPADARDIRFEGPGYFETKMGRKVWGVKITYKKLLPQREIRRGDNVITIGPSWVTRTKIVPLPEGVKEFEVAEEKPKGAVSVA